MGKQRKGVDPKELQKFLDSYGQDKPQTKAKKQADPYFTTGNLGFGQIQPSQEPTPWPTTEAEAPQMPVEDTITDPLDDIVSAVETEPEAMDDLLESVDRNMQPTVEGPPEIPTIEDPSKTKALEQGKLQERITQEVQGLLDRGEITPDKAEREFHHRMKMAQMRPVSRDNHLTPSWQPEDGSESSVKMIQVDNIAFPLLYPKDPNSTSRNPKDWIEYSPNQWREALAEAEKRGEIFNFESEEEAMKFAEGSWKTEEKPEPQTLAKNDKNLYSPATPEPEKTFMDKAKEFITNPMGPLGFMSEGKPDDSSAFKKGVLSGVEMVKAIPDEMGLVGDMYALRGSNSILEMVKDLPDDQQFGEYTVGEIRREAQRQKAIKLNSALNNYKAAAQKLGKYTDENMPSTMKEIFASPENFGKFAAHTLGQAIPQVAMTIGTLGTGTLFMETGIIQMEMLEGISMNTGLSIEEILEKSLANPDWAVGGGLVAGSMDLISLGIIGEVTGLSKVGSKLISKGVADLATKKTTAQVVKEIGKSLAISTLSETIQEGSQGQVEAYTAAKGGDYKFDFLSKENLDRWAVESLAGGIMGVGMAGAGTGISKGAQAIFKRPEPQTLAKEGEAEVKNIEKQEPVEPPTPPAEPTETEEGPVEPPPKPPKPVEPEGTPEGEIEFEEEGEAEVKISKENKIAKDLYEKLSSLAEEGDNGAANLADMFDEFDKEVTEGWIEDAEKIINDAKVEAEKKGGILDPEKRKEYGLEPLKPTYRGTSKAEWEAVKNGGAFKSESGFGENEAEATWVSDKKEYSEDYLNKNDDSVLIEFKPEAIDKSTPESGQDNDNTGVRLGRGLTLDDVQRVTDRDGNVLYDANEQARKDELEERESRIKTVDVPITRIQHDLKRFQNRRAAYSEQSVKNIMDAVEAGTFDLNKFDPIRIWKDPKNNRTYVLAGHSRLEAFNRLSDEKEGFDNIPTIDMSHLTEEEAIKYAKEESNTMATAESVLDVASSWRKDREEGISNAEIQRKNKNRPNVARSELLSWVNPKGKAWAALEAMEGKGSESARVLQIGEFLGHARRQFTKLTDQHENELYDWLADTESGKKITTRPEFINRLENIVSRLDFDPEQPLNIARRTTMGSLEAEARQKDQALKSRLKQAEDERAKTAAGDRFDELTREIESLRKEIIEQNRKIQEAKSADRMQGDLFNQPAPENEKDEAKSRIKKLAEQFAAENLLFPLDKEQKAKVQEVIKEAKEREAADTAELLEFILEKGSDQPMTNERIEQFRSMIAKERGRKGLADPPKGRTPIEDEQSREKLQELIKKSKDLGTEATMLQSFLDYGVPSTYTLTESGALTQESIEFLEGVVERSAARKGEATKPKPPLSREDIVKEKMDFSIMEPELNDFLKINNWVRQNPGTVKTDISWPNLGTAHRLGNQGYKIVNNWENAPEQERIEYELYQFSQELHDAAEKINQAGGSINLQTERRSEPTYAKKLIGKMVRIPNDIMNPETEGQLIEELIVGAGTYEVTDADFKRGAYQIEIDQTFLPITGKKAIEYEVVDKPTRKEELKTEEQEIKDRLKDLAKRFGQQNKAMTGIDPEKIAIASEMIVEAGKLGINKFQQLVVFLEENLPGWLDENYAAFKGAYAYNVMTNENSDEDLGEIQKLSKEDAITEGANINRNAGRSAETASTTETEGQTQEVPAGQGEQTGTAGVETNEPGDQPEPGPGDGAGRGPELSLEQRIERARELGRKAFFDGIQATPIYDPALLELLEGLKVGEGGDRIMKAWEDAWMKANLNPSGNFGEGQGILENARDGGNYVIPGAYEAPKTFNVKRSIKANIEALNVLRDLKEQDRKATPEEQEILFGYVGWGGIKEIALSPRISYSWNASNVEMKPYVQQVIDLLKDIYGDEADNVLSAAKKSILNAHYTSIPIIRGIYATLEDWGMAGNLKILEPSAGTGHFLGAMPQKMRKGSSSTAVELDRITGDILGHLYPNTNVKKTGLQKAGLPDGYYDLVISNIPFGDYKVSDPKYLQSPDTKRKKAQGKIHNYFFAKGLDLVRPGGIVAFITSSGVLDSPSNQFVRELMAREAEMVGAVKLPSTAFKGNAGTEVTTDLIFLRKYEEGEQPKTDQPFIKTNRKDGYNLNEYWDANPANLFGMIEKGGLYGEEGYKLVGPADDLERRIYHAMANKLDYKPATSEASTKEAFTDAYEGENNERPGNLVIHKGKIGVFDAGRFIELTDVTLKKEKLEAYIGMRGSLNALIKAEVAGATDAELTPMREKLNQTYDDFVSKYGRIKTPKNWKWVRLDIDAFNLAALEGYTKDGDFERKADIFTKRTIRPIDKIESTSDPRSAALISLNESGGINMDRISSLLQTGEEEARELLKGVVFELPGGGYEIVDQYLSGNVKKKLKEAEAAAELDERFNENVEALKDIIPDDIPISLIKTHMGARWIPISYYSKFLQEKYDMNPNWDFSLVLVNDEFRMNTKYTSGTFDAIGTNALSGKMIFTHALNGKFPRITKEDPADPKKRILDEAATAAARLQIEKIREEFSDFITDHEIYGPELEAMYNEKFNATVKGKVDGSYLTIPGYAGPELRPHQKDAIAMLLQKGGGIIDHIVGAGKTLVMIAGAMEMKRLGIAKKPVISAKKKTVANIASEAYAAFPAARILVLDSENFTAQQRQATLAKIANNDWDLVIMSHENMGTIPPAPSSVIDVLTEMIEKLELDIEFLQGTEESWGKREAKALEKRKANLEAKIEEMSAKNADASVRTFDQTGIDHIFVDESHTFKNLQYTTRHGNVAGLGNASGSDRANNLMFNIRHLQTVLKGDRGATFLSGTMITNSIVEMYSILNYLRPSLLRELGVENFDAWASVFSEATSDLELGVTGEVKNKARFRKFSNVPELAMMYAEIADVRNDDNMKLPKPDLDGPQLVLISPSKAFQKFTKRLIAFAKTGEYDVLGLGPGTEGQKKAKMLVAANLAQKAAIDMRLIFEEAPEERESKIVVAAEKIFGYYNQSTEYKGTQLVFLDAQNAGEGLTFNTHKALKQKLIDYGIPKDEIVSITGLSDEKTQEVFEKVRNGEVRVMIGHKATMGTGVNVQDRVIAMHHLDIGWNPSNHTQADGRGARQGNWAAEKFLDNKIPSFYYGMENSLDAFKFQHLQTKAQFIAQMTQGNVAERETTEESGDDIEMGTFLASLTGNNALMEEGKVAAKIKKLTLEKRAFTQNKHNNQHKLREEKIKIEAAQKQLPKIKQDAEFLLAKVGGPFEGDILDNVKVTIGKVEFTKPKELGEAIWNRLGELYPDIRDGERVNIGKIYDFDIAIESKKDAKGTRRLHWFVIGPSGIKYTWNNTNGFVAGDVRSDRKLVDLGRVPVESLKKIDDLQKKYTGVITAGDKKIAQLEEALAEEWTQDDEIFRLRAEQERLKEEIAQYDLDEELADDTGGSLWDEDAIFGEPSAARGSKSKGERGKSGASISTYKQRKVTEEEIKQLEKDTKVPWRIHQKLLELTTKWAPKAKVGQGGTSRGAIGTYYPRGKHIRVEGMNDFDVYIHELMHAVDYRFNVATDLIQRTEKGAEIRRRLTDIYEEFYPNAKRTHRLITRMREGLAVLVQQMAQNPEFVQTKYGDLVDAFFKEGGEYAFEGAEEFAQDIENLIVEYQNLPPLEKMKAHIVGAIDTLKRKRDKIVNWRVSFVEELFDNKAVVEDLIKRAGLFFTEDDVTQFMRFIDNSARWAKANISGDRGSYWNFNAAGTELEEKFKFNFKSIREKINARTDVVMEDFGAWLYGRRIHGDFTERNELIKEQQRLEAEIKKIMKMEFTSKLQEAKAMEQLEQLDILLNGVKEEIQRLTNIITNEGISEIDAKKAYELGVDLFKEEADMLDKLMWEDLLLLRKSRIVDEEFVSKASMKYGWYVPFKRVEFDEALRDPNEDQIAPDLKGGGRTTIASTLYRGGSTKPIQDPFVSAEMNHADIMRKATRQMMYNRLIPLAMEMPEFFSPITYYKGIEKDPSVIVAKNEAGNRVALKPHEKIKQVIDENFHIENVNLLAATTITASKMFRTGTTGVYLPFLIANYAMDQISAFVNSKMKLTGLESLPFIGPLVTSAKPMAQDFFVRKSNSWFNTALTVPESDEAKYYQEYRFLGGLSQTFLRSEDLEQNQYFQIKKFESLKGIKPAERLHRAVDSTINFFAVPGLTSEVATRASEYIKARKAGHPQFIALEMAGRVSTPFHHMGRLKFGQKASMKQVVASIPYFNAGLQVPHQMYRTWVESPQGRIKIMGVITTIVAVNAYMIFSLLDDDDRKDQLDTIKAQDPETLARYMFIPTNSGLIKIRMPENYAWLSAITNMAILQMTGETEYKPGDFVSGVTAAVPQQFNILEPWEMLYSIAPPIAKAPIEVAFNKKSYPRVKELVPFYLEGERKDPYASPVANTLSGKEWYQLDMHPKKIDHLITGIFGRAARTVMNIPRYLEKEYWNEIMKKPFYQDLYLSSARQVVNALAIGKEVESEFRDKVTRGNGTPEEKKKLKAVMALLKGTVTDQQVVKKGEYKGNVRFSRKKDGLYDLLEQYRDIDLNQEPARAQELRNRIFDRVRAIEKAWD